VSVHKVTTLMVLANDGARCEAQCEISQASKCGPPPDDVGWQWLYAGQPWQVVAVDMVCPTPLTSRGDNWILVLTNQFAR